jgi:hypothetical protein
MSSTQANTAFTIGYIVVLILVGLVIFWAWRRTRR